MRWRQIEQEYGDRVEIEWKSFLLRPTPPASGEPRDLERFRAYTRSWERPNGEPDSGDFRVWASDEGPPSHSVPAHQLSKHGVKHGRAAWDRLHERLLSAYFTENRDISSESVLRACWLEAGLPEADFEGWNDDAYTREIVAEHQEALSMGATGVPAARLEGNDAMIVGAHPIELYRRWVDKTLERLAEGAD